jgi:archaeal flagellin FlaB
MYMKMARALHRMHRGEKGITGLETAIILIAFVTVAAVLAYTVLSAGIFSAERGQEAVYAGLESAQSTMSVKSSFLVEDIGSTESATMQFTMAMALSGSSVDLTKLVFNYWDSQGNQINGIDHTNITFTSGGDAVTIVEGTEQVQVEISLGAEGDYSTPLEAYDRFTLQIIPPTGATLTLQRTLPGNISGLISLH